MPLEQFEGFDDRLNVNDGWTDDPVEAGWYTAWGLFPEFYIDEDYNPTYYGSGIRQGLGRIEGNCCGYTDLVRSSQYLPFYYNTVDIRFPITSPSNQIVFGGAFRGTYYETLRLEANDSGGIARLALAVVQGTDDGTIRLSRRTLAGAYEEFASSPLNLVNDYSWFYLEVVANLASFIQVYVNGNLVIDYTGQVNLYPNAPHEMWINECTFMDDLYFYTGDSTRKGDCIVESLLPTAAGNYAQFTPLSGSNYEMVDDAPDIDFDTSYNSGSGSGTKDSFTMADMTTTSGTVRGVEARALCQATASEQVRLFLRISGTDYFSPTKTPTSDHYTYVWHIWETNPATSQPWTIGEVNGVEVGYEVL